MKALAENKLKEGLRKVYSSVQELWDHHTARIEKAGNPSVPEGRAVVCLTKEPLLSDSIFVPDTVDPQTCTCTATVMLDKCRVLVEIPVYCGIDVAGMPDVRVIMNSDVFCYWTEKTLKEWLK